MAADVHKFVKHCDSCQRNKTLPQIPAGKLQSMPIPAEKWRSISMDFITDLPVSTDGYDSIMVFVDRLTKMVHLAPCHKTDTAEQVAWIFLNHVVRLHGLPSAIVSDRDPKFLSNFWTELLKQLHVTTLTPNELCRFGLSTPNEIAFSLALSSEYLCSYFRLR